MLFYLNTYLSVLRPQKEGPWMVVVVAMMELDAHPSLAAVLVFTSPAAYVNKPCVPVTNHGYCYQRCEHEYTVEWNIRKYTGGTRGSRQG
jgi:hypothetical protein